MGIWAFSFHNQIGQIMELATQGVIPDASAIPQGNGANGTASAGVVDPNLTASADPSATATQGGDQGVSATVPDEIQRQIQSAIDKQQAKFLAEKYQLEQQLQQMQAQQLALLQSQQQRNVNPYNPETHPNEWWDWKIQDAINQTTVKAEQAYERKLTGMLQVASQQQWINAHPNEDVNVVRNFARSRWGVENPTSQHLDDALALMKYPSQMNTVAQNAINQTYNQFRQPNQTASTLRGGVGGAAQVAPQGSYEQDAKAYIDSNGAVYNSWTPDRQKAFDRETWNRDNARRGKS